MVERKPFKDWEGNSLNKAGRLITEFEGFSSTVYRCQAGVPTIGFGHTKDVKEGQTITKDEALALLMSDLSCLQKAISGLVHVDVTEGQFVALLSLVYNIGVGNFRKSTLLRELNAGRILHTSEQFSQWIYANGRPLKGLMNRRAKEREIFES